MLHDAGSSLERVPGKDFERKQELQVTSREHRISQRSSLVHKQRQAQKKSRTVLTSSITRAHYPQLRRNGV